MKLYDCDHHEVKQSDIDEEQILDAVGPMAVDEAVEQGPQEPVKMDEECAKEIKQSDIDGRQIRDPVDPMIVDEAIEQGPQEMSNYSRSEIQ